MAGRSQPHGSVIELLWATPAELHPNLYNTNILDDDLYAKAVASIDTYGFIDPITVRLVDDRYEIIDGEHRARAARDLRLKQVPIIVVDVDDDTAQQLSLVLNELRGRPDPAKLQRVLQGLAERHSVEELLRTMPFTREQFLATTSVAGLPVPDDRKPDLARWVERMYRLPRTAADTLDAALTKAKEYEEITEDWRALDAIATAYLDGA